MRCEKRPRPKHSRLNFIQHEKRPGAAAQFLSPLQVGARRHIDSTLGLQWFNDKGCVLLGGESVFECCDIAVRDAVRVV